MKIYIEMETLKDFYFFILLSKWKHEKKFYDAF